MSNKNDTNSIEENIDEIINRAGWDTVQAPPELIPLILGNEVCEVIVKMDPNVKGFSTYDRDPDRPINLKIHYDEK